MAAPSPPDSIRIEPIQMADVFKPLHPGLDRTDTSDLSASPQLSHGPTCPPHQCPRVLYPKPFYSL